LALAKKSTLLSSQRTNTHQTTNPKKGAHHPGLTTKPLPATNQQRALVLRYPTTTTTSNQKHPSRRSHHTTPSQTQQTPTTPNQKPNAKPHKPDQPHTNPTTRRPLTIPTHPDDAKLRQQGGSHLWHRRGPDLGECGTLPGTVAALHCRAPPMHGCPAQTFRAISCGHPSCDPKAADNVGVP
jgi:hypothetical protein